MILVASRALADRPPRAPGDTCTPDTPCAVAAPSAGDPEQARFKAALGPVVGLRGARLGGIEKALARDQFTSLSPVRFVGGVDVGAAFDRARIDVDFATGRAAALSPAGDELATWITEVAASVDYEVFRSHDLSVFAGTGAVYGWLRVETDTPGSTLFGATNSPYLQTEYFAVPVDLGAELLLPVNSRQPLGQAVVIGLRGGPLFQVHGGNWENPNGTPSRVAGPDADATGFRVLFSVGGALYSRTF